MKKNYINKEKLRGPGCGQAPIKDPARSKKQLKRMRKTVLKKLQKEVGVNYFMNILEIAAFALLDDMQRRCRDEQTYIIHRSQLYDTEGRLSQMGRDYLTGAALDMLSDLYDEWSNMENMVRGLIRALDEESFRFFEAKHSRQRRKQSKDQINSLN